MSRSDVVINPFIFLLTCHKSKQSFYSKFRKVITLISSDSIDQKVKLERRRNSIQKQLVLIEVLNQVAWIADLTTKNSLIGGPD